MKVQEYDMPDDLYYHKDHTWARRDGDIAIVGFNDFGVKLAGAIKRVQTAEEDDEVAKDKPIGTLSSGKWTGKIYAPVSGEVTEVNEELEDEPGAINEEPYGKGWVIKIKMSNPAELDALFKPGKPGFDEWINGEIAKHKK